jgi:hypothetical protein
VSREYDPDYGEQLPPSDVQNFYRLLAASEEKVYDGTDVVILQVVTRLMVLKSKYNFFNQCYNDIIKLIIDPISSQHNMLKDLYQSKKILASTDMNYEKINVCEKNYMLFWKEHKDDIECAHYGRSQKCEGGKQ